MAACALLVLLAFGVGSVMTFVYGGGTFVALVVGAVLLVMSWHGLRRIDPSGSDERPAEDWGVAILVTVLIGAIMIGGLVWTPWLTIFAVIVFSL
jgi:ABC-type branched-subunit amino acid transport system permease subunit